MEPTQMLDGILFTNMLRAGAMNLRSHAQAINNLNVFPMLNLPCELYTPIFAVARIAGWSGHRIEEIENAGKIIRPSYMGVKPEKEYRSLENR